MKSAIVGVVRKFLPEASRIFGEPLAREARRAFRDETVELNRRRMRVMLPIMALVHLGHVVMFWMSPAQRAAFEPNVVSWREGLLQAHALTMVPVVALALLAWRPKSVPLLRASVGPLAGLTYLLHAALVGGVDQLVVENVTPFIGYAFGIAVVLASSPSQALGIYTLGWLAIAAALLQNQIDPALRMSQLSSATSAAVIGVALSTMLASARRRDFSQRRIIDEQRAALAVLNTGLELRVRDQVREIVARAEEVEVLNAQLQTQVRTRSQELSFALSRLAFRRDVDGKLAPGTLLGGRFEVLTPIGEGGMATVYSGIDQRSSARVAIKVIQATSARHLDAMHRFLAEARTVAAIAHPAVVRMIHVDIAEDGLLFQAQELIEGETLESKLDKGSMAPALAARIAAVLAEALAAAHAVGVVHRDVKPDNVMLTTSMPGLKLLDFGIATLADDGSTWVTKTGIVVGTPSYMAPEQVDGDVAIGDRADVYALGVVLFRMLSARLPFDSASARARMWRRTMEDAPDVTTTEAGKDVPRALADVVARCLARRAEDRPTATEVARALHALADALGASALEPITLQIDAVVPNDHREPTVSVRTPRRTLEGTIDS